MQTTQLWQILKDFPTLRQAIIREKLRRAAEFEGNVKKLQDKISFQQQRFQKLSELQAEHLDPLQQSKVQDIEDDEQDVFNKEKRRRNKIVKEAIKMWEVQWGTPCTIPHVR